MANPEVALTPEQAQFALLSMANGARIGTVAVQMGLHHQTLKRLLIEYDAQAFEKVYQPEPKQRQASPPPPPPAPVVRDEVAQIQRELAAGRTIREVAKSRCKSVQQIAAMLPDAVVAEVAPAHHRQQEKAKQKAAAAEVLRLLQMEVEPADIVERVEGVTLQQVEEVATYCKADTLGSRWALKTFGCFTCHTGRSGTLRRGKVDLPAVWVRCRCGHEQWKAVMALAMGITACEQCGASR